MSQVHDQEVWEKLRTRLDDLGMEMDETMVRYVLERLEAHGTTHHDIRDLQLMTIAVDSYRTRDTSELV